MRSSRAGVKPAEIGSRCWNSGIFRNDQRLHAQSALAFQASDRPLWSADARVAAVATMLRGKQGKRDARDHRKEM